MQILLTIAQIRARCAKAGISYLELARAAGKKHSSLLSRIEDPAVSVGDIADLVRALEGLERQRLAWLIGLQGIPMEQAAGLLRHLLKLAELPDNVL